MSQLCKILVVDDEFLLRQGIKHLIDWQKEGFEIVGEASNGKEALELIKKLEPHIVISDIVMPVMDGVDFSKILKAKYPEIQIIILSSYSNFNYVKDAFKFGVNDYILKPTLNPDDLLNLLKNAAKNIPNFVLKTSETKTFDINFFLCQQINNFDSKLKIKGAEKYFPYNSYCLIGCNIKKLVHNNSTNISLMKSILSEAVKKNFSNLIYYEIDSSEDYFLILLNFEKENYVHAFHNIRKMVSYVSEELPEVFFVQSKTFTSINNLHEIYDKSLVSLFGYRFYFKDKNLISYEDFPKKHIEEKFDFKYYSNQLYLLNIDTALNYLKNFISLVIKNCIMNEFDLKTLLENAIYNILNILDELDFDINELNNSKREIFQKIDEAEFSDDLLSIMNDIISKINDTINKSQNPLNNQMINKIIEYISEHYNEQLSLKQLADIFHFNYYYLSSYFSSYNNEGFSEYLNKIRVEKAAELLCNEKIPVSEISYMVGYSDHSYFCKVFKKFRKVTPSEFRKNIINKKREQNAQDN